MSPVLHSIIAFVFRVQISEIKISLMADDRVCNHLEIKAIEETMKRPTKKLGKEIV